MDVGRVTYAEAMVEFAKLHDQRQRLVDVLGARRAQLARRHLDDLPLFLTLQAAVAEVPPSRHALLLAPPRVHETPAERRARQEAELAASLASLRSAIDEFSQTLRVTFRSLVDGYRRARRH